MNGTLLRVLIFGLVIAAIVFALRRLWRDWTGAFRMEDTRRRQRDLAERQRPGVIDLKRNKDGVFRPGEDDDGRTPRA